MRFAMPRKTARHARRRCHQAGIGPRFVGLRLFITEHGAMVMGDLVLTEDEVGR